MPYSSIDISSVVDVSDWPTEDEELAGSRVKKTVINPDTEELYVFKEPKQNREAQIWSELIASYIAGDLLGWPVQKSYIASKDGRIGNLLKYIYESNRTFLAGEQFCKHVDPQFDPKLGRRHTWALIKKIPKHNILNGLSENSYFQFWARAIAFDTLISNTDRHAENWAILWAHNENPILMEMAPLYDNATSLGCEVDEKGLEKWYSCDGNIIESKVSSYVEKGCHHLSDGESRYKLADLAKKFISDFPTSKTEFILIAELDLKPVEEVINQIAAMRDIPVSMRITKKRKLQIIRLLKEGQARIIQALSIT